MIRFRRQPFSETPGQAMSSSAGVGVHPLAVVAAVGLASGTYLGLGLFVVEPMVLFGGAVSYFGSPLPAVMAVFVLFGAVVGMAVGVLIGLVRRRLRNPAAITVATVGFLLTIVYIGWTSARPPSGSIRAPEQVLIALSGWTVIALVLGRVRARSRVSGVAVWVAAAGAVLLCGGLLAWHPLAYHRLPVRAAGDAAAPNVVMIVVDALRPDHLSAYGYRRDTSPNIDRLSDQGARFRIAYSHGSRTIIAVPALFTSTYPEIAGTADVFSQQHPLPENRVTIAEMLQGAGYITLGMMSNIYLKSAFGMTQGFDRLEEFNHVRFRFSVYRLLVSLGVFERPAYAEMSSPSATEVTDAALEWIGRVRSHRRFFCFVHYMDVHNPYRPPAEFLGMFSSSPAADAVDEDELYVRTATWREDPVPLELTGDELARLVDLYDGCIRFTDTEIGRLLAAIEALAFARETVVVLTSDHGDEFLEHGSLYHAGAVHEQLIRVPLVLWSSTGRWQGLVVDGLARHLDVLPTIAELAGVQPPAAAMGESLVPLAAGLARQDTTETFAQSDDSSALIRGRWKILCRGLTDRCLLYDLSEDPEGLYDVADEHPDVLDRMRHGLDGYLPRVRQPLRQPTAPVDPEAVRQLRELGYVE
jgi:arylsulfatase A-like enzyme/xanthosine utilization system XapX-like protein